MKSETKQIKADFTYLSVGCGVQSGTLTEMIVKGDAPRIDVAIFADTGDEPDYVYEYKEYLTKRLASVGVDLVTVKTGHIIDDLYKNKRFASMPVYTRIDNVKSMMRRQCTREYKIAPIEKAMKAMLVEKGLARYSKSKAVLVNKGVTVEAWMGLSLDEIQRLKPSQTKWINNRWVLVEKRMTRLDCINYLNSKNLPVPKKSSCRVCPFHNNEYWRYLKTERPDDWQHVVQVDNDLRNNTIQIHASLKGDVYLHKDAIPLEQVDLRSAEDKGQMSFLDMCDEGYCGV